jgi:hypothetical protein
VPARTLREFETLVSIHERVEWFHFVSCFCWGKVLIQ